jgi:hypothetical protein
MGWKLKERMMGLSEGREEATLVSFTSQDVADTAVTQAFEVV